MNYENIITAVIKECPKKDITDDRSVSDQQWCLYSKDETKLLGRFPTKSDAERHEKEVQYFKHKGSASPLIERRDYTPYGYDMLEQNAIGLAQKGLLPDELVDDFDDRIKERLASGETPKEILIAYYNRRTASLENKKAAERLAFAPTDFFKDIADKMKVGIADIIKLFKNSKVVQFFNKIRWSFKRFYDLLYTGYKHIKEVSKIVTDFVQETNIKKSIDFSLEVWDTYLKAHPRLKALSGVIVSAVLLFIYWIMADSGNPNYDYDFSDIYDALSGNFQLADIFGGKNGSKLFMLFVTGAAVNMTFPWPGPLTVRFIAGLINTLAKKVGIKFVQREGELLYSWVVNNLIKEAYWKDTEWLEKKVRHKTPKGYWRTVKVKSLPPDERKEYNPVKRRTRPKKPKRKLIYRPVKVKPKRIVRINK